MCLLILQFLAEMPAYRKLTSSIRFVESLLDGARQSRGDTGGGKRKPFTSRGIICSIETWAFPVTQPDAAP